RFGIVSGTVTITQAIPSTADRKAFFVEKMPDSTDQQDLVMLIITPVAAPLQRLKLRELLFPVAQHVWLDATQFADLANREITLGGNGRQVDGSFACAHGLIWDHLSFIIVSRVRPRRPEGLPAQRHFLVSG